ncbi:MCE family protein [bacterium]|nr:MCE family protein [bacterium]
MDLEAQEMKSLRKKQLAVGTLFVLTLCLTLLFAYWMGAVGFNPTKKIHVEYDFAGGLQQGSPVRLGGIKVGRVTDLQFSKAGNGHILATLKIDKSAFGQITEDSKFFINLAGLIGERYVEIVPGQGGKIESDVTLVGVNPPRIDQLFSQGYGIFGDLREFYSENKVDIKETFQAINELSSNLNKLLGKSSPQQRKQIGTLVKNFSSMSSDLKKTVESLSRAVAYMETHKAAETWDGFAESMAKIRKVEKNDIRRLMLEDGMKVNFGSTKVVDEPKEKKK